MQCNLFCFREKGKLPRGSGISSWALSNLTQELIMCWALPPYEV